MADAEAATDPAVLAELRRRIQGSFSPGELRTLGAALGLEPSEAWDRGADATARDLVRRGVESPGLVAMVLELQQAKPLVEWGDLLPSAPSEDTVVESAVDVHARLTPIHPLPGNLTPPPIPPTIPGEPAPGSQAGPLSVAGTGPPSAGWPLTNVDRQPPPKTGIDPKLFVIAIACIAVAVIVAFVGGMVVSRRGPEPTAAAPGRANGLAGHAATAVDGALIDVARACGLQVPPAPGREVLRAVQVACGHPVAAAARPLPGIDPSSIEPPDLEVAPEVVRRPAGGNGPARTPRKPSDPCRSQCTAEHGTCKGGCGSEPRDASDYDAWQGCMSKCLSAESRCRQRCSK